MTYMVWASGVLQCTWTKIGDNRSWSQHHKPVRSTDRSLQLSCVKKELVVILDKNAKVNVDLGIALTARQGLKEAWV